MKIFNKLFTLTMRRIPTLFLFLICLINVSGQSLSDNNPSSSVQVFQLSFVQPDELRLEVAKPVIVILKGSVIDLFQNFEAFGGKAPYNYRLTYNDTTFNAHESNMLVSPGDTTTYQITVFDANGCSADGFVDVNVIYPLQVISTFNNVNCFGANNGTVSLEVTYGVPPYTFEWSNGADSFEITDLMAGIYHVTVTDSLGQVFKGEYPITEPNKIEKFIEVAICANETHLVGPKSYTEAGNYIDTLTTAMGCDSILHLSLTVNPLPEIPTITIMGDTLISSSNNNQWFYANGTPIGGATKKEYMVELSGAYYVVAYNQYGCSASSDTVLMNKTNAIDLKQTVFNCIVYPNPNKGLFTLKLINNKHTGASTVLLFSVDGKLINNQTIELDHAINEKQLEFKYLKPGVYYLQVISGDNIANQKIVIQ